MSKHFALAFVSVALAIGAPPLSAAPVVQGISGSVLNSATLTIVGTGFGSKPVAAPLAYDSFDSYPADTFLGDLLRQGSRYGYLGRPSTDLYRSSVVTSPAGRTGKSARVINFPSATDPLRYQRQVLYSADSLLSTSRYFTIDAWLYTDPDAWSGSAGYQFKSFGLSHDPDWSDQTPGFITCFWNYTSGAPNFPGGMLEHWPSGALQDHWMKSGILDRTWIHLRCYVDAGSVGGSVTVRDGSLQLYNENTPIVNTPAKFYDDSVGARRMLSFYFGAYVGSATTGGRMDAYWDDVYIDNSWARVEIGNASVYSSCTHREIQIPSAWTPSAVSCTVSQGSFANGQQAFLYVADATGTMNAQGYPITFGGTVSESPGQPGQPTR